MAAMHEEEELAVPECGMMLSLFLEYFDINDAL